MQQNNQQKIYSLLADKTIGLSISESEDLKTLGFNESHLVDAKVEIARHFLSFGAILMYGGDLRNNGYTNILLELVDSYKPSNINEDRLSLINYLGWPLHITLSEEIKASYSERISFKTHGLPDDLPRKLSAKKILNPITPKDFYAWARSMTFMREEMTKNNNARIVLGGKTLGYKGKYPGIVEEIYLSLKANKPTFLIGAFNGATGDAISALLGKKPERLSFDFQNSSKELKQRTDYYNEHKPKEIKEIDYEYLVSFFNKKGIESLNNGLTEEENRRLFKTVHIPEMISLILKGLVTIFNK
ncbi:MAG: hypothetical protein ACI9DK_000975 [Vicingaceae bacterium]|jgi:hypothetical protein